MKTQVTTKESLKASLTLKEFAMLEEIISWYTFDDNVCFMRQTTSSEKGLITQLKNKELIYDSFEGMHDEIDYERSNWFPSEFILDIYGLEHY
jgi:hypothetical protein